MVFHLPALPGRSVSRDNSSCAYSGYVRKMATMMLDAGHHVVIYGSPNEDPPDCTEYVPCYRETEPVAFSADAWEDANRRAGREILVRREDGDILGVIGGLAQRALGELCGAFSMPVVEYRVGYGGTFTAHRVFETYAWMHTVYGAQAPNNDAHAADGGFYDAVIPPPFEVEDFPAPAPDGDYLLYVGRLIERKGVGIAVDVAKAMDRHLLIAGEGDFRPGEGDDGVTYLGHVGPTERGELMAGARCLLAPTLYVEPGGGVAIEAQLCGTPAITTDWGCFTETVKQGRGGFRCRSLAEFVVAVDETQDLDRDRIRASARRRYSLDAIGTKYDLYFDHLRTVYGGDGFYEARPAMPWWGR